MTENRIIKALGMMAVRYDPEGLDANLALYEDHGFTYAEVAVAPLRVIANGRISPARAEQMQKVLGRRRLKYTAHAPLILNLMDEEHLELQKSVCRAAIEFCGRIGAETLVVHPGTIDAARALTCRDRLMAMERDALLELADVAAGLGVRLALENLPVMLETLDGRMHSYAFDPARLARQIQAIDHPAVCGTIDFSHAGIAAAYLDIDPLEALKPLAPLTNHLHVHDSFCKPPTLRGARSSDNVAYGMGDLHLPAGWGSVDYERLLPELAIRPGTVMIFEVNQHYICPEVCTEMLNAGRRYSELLEQAARRRGIAPAA